jgi:hypothetical protein
MRKHVLAVAVATSMILLTAMVQNVLAQELLLDNQVNQNGRWSFILDQGDKLTGELTCTTGTLDLLIWLSDSAPMHRQRAWEGRTVPFSWAIPFTGNWTVEVFDVENSTCTGWIKLDVERVPKGFFALDPTWRAVLLGIVVVSAIAMISLAGYTLFRRLKKPKKSS